MGAEHSKRAVALVGRPNVGKSALFNRLIGRRLAIVHEQWGVTRDRLADEVEWEGERFTCMDTGGLGVVDRAQTKDEMVEGVRRQVNMAVEEAAVIVLVADIRSGLHPLDIEVARWLRRQGRPVLLAANKADDPEHDAATADFAELGFPVYAVSALHGRGLSELMTAVRQHLPPADEEPTLREPVRIAVVGRPNVGKSSFINRLLGSERLIVSDQPGTTRDSVAVPFAIGTGAQARHYVWVDTAGMRPRAKVRESVEFFSLVRVEHAIREAHVVAHVLDATEGPGRQDRHIAGMIQQYERGAILIVNKWDQMTRVTPREYEAALRREMPFLGHVPVVFVSARTGRGMEAAVAATDRVAAQISVRLSTGLLNRAIHRAVERVQPPAVHGLWLKVYYTVQTGVQPLRVRLFVNEPRMRTPAYEAYLVRELRSAFGLEGAPVVMEFVRSGPSERSSDRPRHARRGGGK